MERRTRQRDAVLDAMQRTGRAMTPPEILALAREAVPTLNLSTIYRQIGALQEEALVTRVLLPGQPARYEPVCHEAAHAASHHHHHFHCTLCDRVFALHGCPGHMQSLAPSGFRVDSHELTLHGQCVRLPPGDPAMTPDLSIGALALFFALGLRHGLEPDHIAAIDGMTLRAIDRREAHAPWVGALFALGHACVVAVLALAVGLLATSIDSPPAWVHRLNLLPVLLLALLGVWNLRALLADTEYRPDSLRMKLMPSALRERTDAGAVLLIGVLFAMVIDTVAHVTAWSAFATSRGGAAGAMLAGLLFSAGMLATSAADSQLVCHLLRDEHDAARARRMRRGIGWFVVVLSFAVAGQGLAQQMHWTMVSTGDWIERAVVASIVVLAALWWWRRRAAAPVRQESQGR